MRKFNLLALVAAGVIISVATTSIPATAQTLTCSDHKASCQSSCSNPRFKNSPTCIGPDSGCVARFRKCMKTGAWTSLVNNPGTRPAIRK